MKRTVFMMLTALLSYTPALFAGGDKLLNDFKSLPEDQRVAVYWYWISDNISVEGVQHDLEAMKKAGIGRAFIAHIWQDDVKPGNIKVFSPEWWKVLHAALKKATELDIEIGLFNCPGWSQSGGPWIEPQQSMRYLAQQHISVEGNGTVQHISLPEVGKDAKDVRVVAVPILPHKSVVCKMEKEASDRVTKDIHLDEPMTLRSVLFETSGYLLVDATLEAKVGSEYKTLRTEHLDRTNHNLNVGFHPLAPISLNIPDVTAQDFRLTLSGGGQPTRLTVTLSEQPLVERYEEKTLGKMFQSPLPMWDWYIWPTQPEPLQPGLIVQPRKIIDLTQKMQANGKLEWEVPAGEWTIYRTAMLTTGVTNAPASPEATGMEVDKMSQKHVADHFEAFMGEILRRIPAKDRKTLVATVEDSYEMGGQNWTDDMIPVFRQTYGYDPVPWLPVMYGQVVGSQARSERFLWDLRRLVADRVAYDYVAGLRKVSNKHGLTTWLECYGHWGFPGEFLMYGGQSDEVAGEFWSEGDLGDIENRAASSCAHIYGKQKVWAESCTAGGPPFYRYPAMMKQRTDRFFCEGINATLLHLYIQQPDDTTFPGVSADFGNEFNRKNIWFQQMDLFTDYLRRCNLMLQQGRYIADVAYFIGEDVPKMTGETSPALPRGYSFDYINAEVLKQCRVKDGCLSLPSGMLYRVLVLPQQKTMRPEVLGVIERLVKQGLTILGPKPTASPSMQNYPECDQQVCQLANKLFAAKTYGKGRIYVDGTDLQTVFDELGIRPDCYADQSVPYAFIHRSIKDRDIYFVSNQSDQPQTFDASFRIQGKAPDTWDPVTGEKRCLPQYQQRDGLTIVPLHLEPYQSLFVVFDAPASKRPVSQHLNYPKLATLAQIDTLWTVSFQSEMRGPAEPQTFRTLIDWSQSKNDAIKYYAGKATYTNTFNLGKLPDGDVWLDLGRVMVMARVYVNGQYAGGVWTDPYRVPVSRFLKQGENQIRIEVVNNWRNRLIGDARLPESERKTYATVNPYDANSSLQESGLLGPVRLVQLSATFCFPETSSASDAPRSEVLLRQGWRFHRGDAANAEQPAFDDSGWQAVTVPHDWAIKGPFGSEHDLQNVVVTQNGEKEATLKTGRTGGLPYIGVGWYRTTFVIDDLGYNQQSSINRSAPSDASSSVFYDASLKNHQSSIPKNVTLIFDGAMSEARVYVNGQEAIFWPYGYNSFYVDVTDLVHKDGTPNTLVVRLENRAESSRWYCGAGLYRNVHVVTTSDIHVAVWGTQVTTQLIPSPVPSVAVSQHPPAASVTLRTTLENAEGKTLRLHTVILGPDGRPVSEKENTQTVLHGLPLQQNLFIEQPLLWSPETPYLYQAVTRVYEKEQLLDTYSTVFGIRTIEVIPDRGFFLNGQVRKFQGVCNHHDLGPLGAAINRAALRRQLTLLKDMGCDAIRTSHNMPAPELVELCDSMGFMMMVEAFDEWDRAKCKNGYHRFFKEWAERDMVNMLRQYRNHASVVMWSIGNEVPTQCSPDGYKVACFLQDICHREDPTRPVTCGMDRVDCVLGNGFAAQLDIPGFNYRAHRYEEAYNRLPQNIVLGSETSSSVSSRGVYKLPACLRTNATYPDHQCSGYDLEYCSYSNLPDQDFANADDLPWEIGQFVWTGFDYLGEPTPYDSNAWPSHSSVFGIIDLASIPKDRFYLYRSIWNRREHTLHVLPHWTWPGHEGKVIPVFVYTDAPAAELFVNGKSQGIQRKLTREEALAAKAAGDSLWLQRRYRLMWTDVKYEPGEIRVVAHYPSSSAAGSADGGSPAVTVRTAGKPHHLELIPDRTRIVADGDDLCYVTVRVVDKDGNLIPDAAHLVQFKVTGAGTFRAAVNGDASNLDLFHLPFHHAFAGQLTAIIQASNQPGTITLQATAKGLKKANLTLQAE